MQNAEKYPLSCSLDTLKNVSSEEAIILEAGCGTGRILRYFHENGYKIIGIDFIENAIAKILELDIDLNAEVGDITKLRFNDDFFTHVLAFGLYHNFEEKMMEDALLETRRVMKKQGLLCASFRADNIQNWLNDRFFSKGLGEKRNSDSNNQSRRTFHKINMTKHEVKQIISKIGFKIVKIYEIENMPLLYKIKFFRHRTHKEFNEVISRRDGYLLNFFGSVLQNFLRKFFK